MKTTQRWALVLTIASVWLAVLPAQAQADTDSKREDKAANTTAVAEPAPKKEQRLRFRDKPVCVCATGLTEKEIAEGQAQERSNSPAATTEKNR